MLIRSLMKRRHFNRLMSTQLHPSSSLKVNGMEFKTDDFTNVTPKILSYLNRELHLQKSNPLSLVRQRIVDYFYKTFTHRGNPIFIVYDRLNPVVTTKQNFDSLLIPVDHVSRSKTDCYYINRDMMLRAHMTAHQTDLLRSGLNNFLMIGDVYRRDEIDSTHYPVFHQVDAVRSQTRDQLFPEDANLNIFEKNYSKQVASYGGNGDTLDDFKQNCHTLEATKIMEHHLKSDLIGLVEELFGKNIEHRWVDAYFPFTHPSWELEIYYQNKWMEVLGCGIVRNEILMNAGPNNSIAYAFGLGLERIAMALYEIPDIRLMWSCDSGFLSQFDGKKPKDVVKYKAVSSYPQCINDISFWLPEKLTIDTFVDNDFYEMVREIGGDIIEQVKSKDRFIHPKSKRHSLCYSIIYRHLERTLTQAEVNDIHKQIEDAVKRKFHVQIR